ncbi:MAG: 50S ribosomal protein L3 [Nanoarchaeota archaeon]|nr:50S ribosomal protein L3 [Nanoarchaeota archaeon]MBU1051614.1 50S ribosomal protein L3 [Nanoarchaeota archaeon]
MPKTSRPRKGSLQFWPRKRAAKVLPSANWRPISAKSEGLLGFVAYKVAMATAIVKDTTDKSMTQNKQIALPVTILEVPSMKIFSVRFYKNNKPLTEIIVSNEKELKRKVRVPKEVKKLDNVPEGYDDIRVIAYSLPKQTSIKKIPDVIEIAIQADNKLEFVKNLIGKEISLADFVKSNLLDVRGLTKGKGTQGPVKRFGITLKVHKTEKGVRRPGSIGPWHPARVTFHVPMAGQLGYFSRLVYNLNVITSGKITESDINPKAGFKHYGKIKTSFIILKGSVPGPKKRQILLTPAFRPSKIQAKKKFEFLEVVQ